METITIEGMDEHEFRFSIEDMLRLDKVEEAVERLRGLLEPYAGDDRILPSRFLRVSADDLEFAGWNRLADRLYNHDRPGRPISAIGVAMADYRSLGGRGPTHGWLAPFIKTFYFSDEAYPFSDATRHDLLDGYTREGFGWHGDYQATDATLSVKGIDDLYGAVVEIENRLLECDDPPLEEIYAGTIGACYLAALIHQSLRETIRANGLPRPLCVLAACDGVFPFFDAPVAGLDECTVAQADKAVADRLPPNGPEEDEQAQDGDQPGEGSLLSIISRKGTKSPIIALGEEEAMQAAQLTERAGAQRMLGADAIVSEALQLGFPVAERTDPDEDEEPLPIASEIPVEQLSALAMACDGPIAPPDRLAMDAALVVAGCDSHSPDAGEPALTDAGTLPTPGPPESEGEADAGLADVLAVAPARHSLRSRINPDSPDTNDTHPGKKWAIVVWLRGFIFRR